MGADGEKGRGSSTTERLALNAIWEDDEGQEEQKKEGQKTVFKLA